MELALLLQRGEHPRRNGQHAGDLRTTLVQRREVAHGADERGHEDARHEGVDRREGAEHLREHRIETDLLVRLAERRRDERLIARLGEPPRERDLSRMTAEMGRPLGEQQRRFGLLDQQREDGGEPLAGVGLRMRIRVEPFAQHRTVIRERHDAHRRRPPTERRPRRPGRG